MNPEEIPGKAIAAIKKFKATIVLLLLLIFSYLIFSGGNLFIDKDILITFAFSLGQPLNLLSYMLMHMSIWHLVVNIIGLIAFAAIVEKTLSSKDVVAIFVFSGALTVVAFAIFNPHTALMGASAGVSGLMATALILDVKKALAGLAILVIVFLLIFPAVTNVVEQNESVLTEQKTELEQNLQQAIERGDEEQIAIISIKKEVVETKLTSFTESKDFAADIDVDLFLHSYAAIFGIVYLMLFRRWETKQAIRKQNLPYFRDRY